MTPMLRREANVTFQRTLTRTILLPLLLLVLLAFIFFFLISTLLDATRLVERTERVIAATNNLEASIFDQETGLRGFLLTDSQPFLDPYTQAISQTDQKFTTLADLVVDNPLQVERVNSIRRLNSEWQEFARDTLARKESGEDFLSPVLNGIGKQRVDAMRVLIGQMRTTEEELQLQRTTRARQTTTLVLVVSLLSALGLGVALAFATRRVLLQLSNTYNNALQSAEKNEQELYTQRELFRSTLVSIGDAVISTDVRGAIVFMNPVAETLTGWTTDEAQGKPIDDVFKIVNEQTHEPAEVPIRQVLNEGIVLGLANHTMLVRRDGTSMPIDDSAAPVRDLNGVLVGAVLVFRDISERYRSEQELRASERRYRDFAEAMPLSIYTADASGNVDYYNSHWLTYTGITMDDVREGRTGGIIHPDDLEPARERWQAALASGTSYDFEYRRRRADGQYRWQLGRAVPVRDANGTINQWVGTAVDIDDTKRAEQKIRASEKRYRDLAEAMPVLVFTTTPDGSVDYYNKRWYDYTGLTPEQAMGQVWPELIHPDDWPSLSEHWGQALANSTPLDTEFRFRRYDGEYRWQLVRAIPISNPEGEIVQWVGTNVDIESQKQAEEDLVARTRELSRITATLEERNRELDQFAYVTSHDLKAPLRGIANLSQWIEEDLGTSVTEDIRKQLDLLRGRVHRMEGLIDGILQFSRIGRVKNAVELVDVNELVADVVDLLAPPDNATVMIEPDLPRLHTERLYLQQVFQNLIGNAIKYGSGRPDLRVDVRCADAGGFYQFSVADNGPGIAPQYHDKVFIIFQTLSSRDKVEGTGLGLSLVKKIVELHGGRVWLESQEGAGATFHFTWPKRA